MKNKNGKILVEIASYRDPELLNTVRSAIIQADYPERIYFSICYQDDDKSDYEKLKQIDNCKLIYLKDSESRGSCYARYLCQKLIDDEEYIYQVDSHMRFVKHWDTKMIEQLLSLNDSKAVISYYPPSCTEEMMKLPLDDETFDEPASGGIMVADKFRNYDTPFVQIKCEVMEKDNPKANSKSAFISAGNFFSFSEVHKEVLHDPNMYFYGDEMFMDINLFTHGWNIYNSGVSYVYHKYNRKEQKFSKVDNAMDIENNRFIKLLKSNNDSSILKEFNLGTERTIEEFEKFSGIDFKKRIIYLNAETGELENKKFIGKLSYFSKKAYEEEKKLNKKDIIEVIVIDIYGDYKDCIKYSLNNSKYKNRIKFIVGSTKGIAPTKKECDDMHIKKFVAFDEKKSYSEIVSKLSDYVGDNYVAIIDSSIRLLNDWDKYLCEKIKICGDNSALTSWVWETNNLNEKLSPYINIVKEIREFYNYLPILEYNSEINFSEIEEPYQTAVFFDGFIFYHSKVLKKIKFDPNLNYNEQKYIYSLRLWTYGIDLYVPKISHVARIRNESLLMTDNSNLNVICSLSGIKNYYTKSLEADYPYDVENKRPVWTWYKFINKKYDMGEKKLIEK